MSGTTATDETGQVVGVGDPYRQAVQTIQNIQRALHALGALVALGVMWRRLSRLELSPGAFQAAQLFWYFVVGLWPILYLQVYL